MFYITGIIISFFLSILLISKKRKTQADKILITWLVIMGIHLLLFYLSSIIKNFPYPHLLGLEIPFPLLHGPFLYLYTATMTNRIPGNKKIQFLHFIPAILSYLYLIQFYTLSANQKITVYKHKGAEYEPFLLINSFAIFTSGITYVIWSAILLSKHKKSILNQFSDIEKINLNWLRYLIYGISIIWVIVIFGNEKETFFAAVLFVLFIGYFGIKQVGIFTNINSLTPPIKNDTEKVLQPIEKENEKEIEEDSSIKNKITSETSVEKKKYSKSGLSKEAAEDFHKLLSILMNEKKLFIESNLSLSDLAKKMKIHPNYLSQLINEKEGKNFYDYINTLRVEEFKKQITNPINQKYTILAIAYKCGFNSKSSFNRYFKKITNLSPSEYLHKLNIEKNQ